MLETWLSIIILFEVLITLFILWGFMHEGKFIEFEDRVIYTIKRKIAEKRNGKVAK